MTERFEVGQKVRFRGEEVTVTYGPYTGPTGLVRYIVKDSLDTETPARKSEIYAIPTPPAFAVGDEVTYNVWGAGTVQFGPYTDAGEEVYLVKFANGRTAGIGTRYLKPSPPAVKVGDRVRVVKDDESVDPGEFVGLIGTVSGRGTEGGSTPYRVSFGTGLGRHGDPVNGHWFCAEVVPVTDEDTYEHDGVVYDLTAKYRDRDGDTLRIGMVNGVARARFYGGVPDEESHELSYVVANYGPLTRV
ncbi:phiSA1p31-related protein [Streptomyces ardesiacus]